MRNSQIIRLNTDVCRLQELEFKSMHGRFENVLQASGPDNRALQSWSLQGEVGTSGIQTFAERWCIDDGNRHERPENTYAL